MDYRGKRTVFFYPTSISHIQIFFRSVCGS